VQHAKELITKKTKQKKNSQLTWKPIDINFVHDIEITIPCFNGSSDSESEGVINLGNQ